MCLKKIVNANGTATTPDDEFAFTATFAFPKGTDANTLGGIKANGGDVTLAEGGTYTFHLKANKNMKFHWCSSRNNNYCKRVCS